jgi:tetratricopeptide (TPR) repeat protein
MSVEISKKQNNKNRSILSVTKNLQLLKFTIVIIGLTSFSSGCSPAGFAVSAVLIKCYLNEQAKNNRPTIYQPRQQPVIISQQPETIRPIPQFEDRKTVEKANQAYRSLEWNESARLLTEAISRGELSNSDQGEAYILLGAMAYQQGQTKQAGEYFKQAAKLDSNIQPSSELFPPQVVKFYNSICKSGA